VPDITSRQHPIVKAFKSAVSGDDPRALLDGWHLLHDAVAAGIAVDTVLVDADRVSDVDAALLDQVARTSAVFTVSASVMAAASPVRTPAGVVALAVRRMSSLHDVLSPAPALVIVAVDIQDPGNAGAIVRSAEAGGATGVVFGGASADVWSWKALRAAMGSTFRLPIVQQHDAGAALASLRRAGVQLLAAVPGGGMPIYDAELRPPTALLVGGEGAGLSIDLIGASDDRVSIPMEASIESLNAAVAAALLVYEARRQRTV
jgi:RNA methyltransferase, TrmH family